LAQGAIAPLRKGGFLVGDDEVLVDMLLDAEPPQAGQAP